MSTETNVPQVKVNIMTQAQYDAATKNENEFYVISDSEYLESITSSDVINALGFTPYDSANPDGYQTTANLTTVIANTSTDSQYPSAKAVYATVHANETAISNNTSAISTINGKIPLAATTENQLADKSFVNSSISTNTANFIGTFDSLAALNAYSGTKTNNDYAFVTSTDSAGNTVYNRYKYVASTSTWTFEYALNNSSFTADQWAAINSGITSNSKVTRSSTAAVGGTTVPVYINSSGVVTAGSALNTAAYVADNTLVHLAGAETITGNKTFSGTVNLGSTAKATTPTATSNDTSVATTAFVKAQGYKTTVTSSDVTTALGFTPVSSTVAVTHTASTAVGNSTIPVYVNTSGVATTCKALNTAAYVADNTLVHLAGAETITGNKTFSGTVSLGSSATATTPTSSDNSTKVATTKFVKDQGYITGITSSDISTALGFTPANYFAGGNISIDTVEKVTLPSGYTQVAYIEGTGTQYIDTGWKFSNTYPVKIDCKFIVNNFSGGSGGYPTVYGLQTSAYTNWIYPFYINAGNFNAHIGGSAAIDSIPCTLGQVYNTSFTINNGTWSRTINDSSSSGSWSGTITTAASMFLGGGSYGSSPINQLIGKIFSFKITVNGSVVRNYIPCKRDSDGVAGMYDLATSTFKSSGSGSFLMGSTVTASGDMISAIVPTKMSQLTNDSGFITGITSSDVTTALGYTPYNSNNPSGYQANVIETVKVNGTALTPSSKTVDVTVPTTTTAVSSGGTSALTSGGAYSNLVSSVAAGTTSDKITVTKAGSATTITVNNVAYATAAGSATSATSANSATTASVSTTRTITDASTYIATTSFAKQLQTQQPTKLVSYSATITIGLEGTTSLYKITPTGNITSMSFGSITSFVPNNTTTPIAYTFELCIDTGSTARTIAFPSGIKWLDGEAPDLSEAGVYFLAFRTLDRGTTWYGNLQGKW